MNLWQHKIEENKWEVTQWATNPDSLAGLQSSLVAESKIEHWHSELRCWLLTPGNLGLKMAPGRCGQLQGGGGGRLLWGKALLCLLQRCGVGFWAIRDRFADRSRISCQLSSAHLLRAHMAYLLPGAFGTKHPVVLPRRLPSAQRWGYVGLQCWEGECPADGCHSQFRAHTDELQFSVLTYQRNTALLA